MGIRSPQFNFQSYKPRNDLTLGDPWRPCLKMVKMAIYIHSFISWFITLKIELWAPYTHWHAVLKGQVILRQNAKFGPDYWGT